MSSQFNAPVMSTPVEQDQELLGSNSRTGLKRKQEVTPEGAGICSDYTYQGMTDINASNPSDTYIPSNDAIAKVISVIVTNEFSHKTGENLFNSVLARTGSRFDKGIDNLNGFKFDRDIDGAIKDLFDKHFENIKKAIQSTSVKEFRDAETNKAGVSLMESAHFNDAKIKLEKQTLGERISNFNSKENVEKIQETAENMYCEMSFDKFMSSYEKTIMEYIKPRLYEHFKYNATYTVKAISSTTSDITLDSLHDRLSKFSVKTEQQETPRDEDACGLQATSDDTEGIKFACTQNAIFTSEQSMSEEERVVESLD